MKVVKNHRLEGKFDYPIVQYVKAGKKSCKRRVGVLFAGVVKDQPDKVAVGFSLCNESKNDKFDKVTRSCGCFKKKENLGLRIAQSNSLKWLNNSFVFTSEKNDAPPFEAFVKIPLSFLKSKSKKQPAPFVEFVDRLKRYYKDKKLPTWVTVDWEDQIKECGIQEEESVAASESQS